MISIHCLYKRVLYSRKGLFTSDYTHVYYRSLNVAVDIDTTDETDPKIPHTTYDTTAHNESIDEHERVSAVLALFSVLRTVACAVREPGSTAGSCEPPVERLVSVDLSAALSAAARPRWAIAFVDEVSELDPSPPERRRRCYATSEL